MRALADSTIRQTYTVLRAGLDGAVRDGLLARNPAALVKRPGVERAEARHLDAHDVAVVLRAAEASRYHPALVLIASTGLRKGEALALRWDRVDLDAGTLKGRGDHRSGASCADDHRAEDGSLSAHGADASRRRCDAA